ncbi:uncharacterized protein LOC128245877 [Mya arenaria]|uniref:uncharacterized protein LOC128245877 n=1 Tax=Mya arenaria TaxID=6604 RepID=UPI0022DF91FE|nr:uncharacterized protein LOC128245877 [Mya arenaria]
MQDKASFKTLRANIPDRSGKYMHDQFPPSVADQRRKLVPIMLAARKDGKDAYMKYNKLFVDGQIYTDGKFIEIINVVAMPLFTKIRHKTGKPNHASFEAIKRAAWFDKECYEKKRVYMEAVKRFNALKSDENRQLLFEAKRAYKLLTMNKKRSHTITKMKDIEGLKKKKPKDFWKYFSKRKAKRGNNIQVKDFQEYFQTLSDGLNGFSNPEAEQFSKRPSDPSDPIYEELDNDITPAEVTKAIQSLKRAKAGSQDGLINEYFIEAGDIVLGHLTDLFNLILNSGFFPDSWMESIIVPVYKKGDEDQVTNFRGITLMSSMAKLFTSIINTRLMTWGDTHEKLPDSQFGFRKGYSTVEAIFSLNFLIEHMLNNGKRLYVAMVDMKRVFDSINHSALWNGVQLEWIVRVKSEYANGKRP